MGSGVEIIETEVLRDHWSAMWRKAADGQVVQVNRYGRAPSAMLISTGLWREGQHAHPELAVADSRVIERTSTTARIAVSEIIDDLEQGNHTLVLFRGRPQAVFAPYDWVRAAFPELRLAAIEDRAGNDLVDQVLVVYRKARTEQRLIREFAAEADPVWEADRRLTSLRGPIPVRRREILHGVVYVVDGRVARVRALEPSGHWHEAGAAVSLAPVSKILSRKQIDELLPTLRMYPGDARAASVGASREYVNL
ncbi:hypothetical protein ACWIGI_37525 [Nocardia sp. NPDC055321]